MWFLALVLAILYTVSAFVPQMSGVQHYLLLALLWALLLSIAGPFPYPWNRA